MKHRKKLMLTIWHFIAIGVLLGASLLIGLYLYWTIQPTLRPAIEFPNGIKVVEESVRAGDSVTLFAPYCKNIDTKATVVVRSLQDGLVFYLPAFVGNVPKGCDDNYTTKLEIPRNVPPSVYTYTLSFQYDINPISHQEYNFTTNQFIVLETQKPPATELKTEQVDDSNKLIK